MLKVNQVDVCLRFDCISSNPCGNPTQSGFNVMSKRPIGTEARNEAQWHAPLVMSRICWYCVTRLLRAQVEETQCSAFTETGKTMLRTCKLAIVLLSSQRPLAKVRRAQKETFRALQTVGCVGERTMPAAYGRSLDGFGRLLRDLM